MGSEMRTFRTLIGTLVVLCSAGTHLAVGTASAAPSTKLRVVAAENFWGSIAAQLAGNRATVTNIITNPDTDPHDYEAKPSDGRAIASAKYLIENGIGYDAWFQKLADASPLSGRKILNVGELLGVHAGENPHQW